MATPMWIVWHPAGGENHPSEGSRIRANSAESAAAEWGRQYEWRGCEYTLDSDPEVVMVCPSGEHDMIQAFKVRAQLSRDYFADRVPLPTTEPQP